MRLSKGYRDKIEFTIGSNNEYEQLCSGFMKCNSYQGLLYLDNPKDLPHVSDYAGKCASIAQSLLHR
jgi:hypothetical protein